MSVIYANNNGNNWLGTLGGLATLGGMVIPGAEWLSTLGMGMKAANSAMNGQTPTEKEQNALDELLKGITGNFFQNPASGSMINQNKINELNSRGWGRFNQWQL